MGDRASIFAALFPLRCPGCGAVAEPVCSECARGLRPPCPATPPPGIDAWSAPFSYEGVAREVVARVKYRGAHGAITWLARAMVPSVQPPVPRLVTWAPTSPARRRQRGFDHAELLARAVAALVGRPCRRVLGRCPGPAQTGQPLAARRSAPAFDARRRVVSTVLLVDDVATTGATLAAAAGALRDAGARSVVALTAARTPP
jgi:predicted amidophosphoribosyltransferase